MEETFTYDDMNRLTDITLKRPSGQDLYCSATYDALGRMTSKEAVTKVNNVPQVTTVFSLPVFDNTKVHALSQAQTAEGVFPSTDQIVTYTGFDKVSKVKQGTDSLCYAYGYDRQRISMEEHVGGALRTKLYVGNCEYVTETTGGNTNAQWLTYLSGPTGVFAVMAKEGGDAKIHYILKDNLGSWTTVTNRNGVVVQDVHFDPWGTPYYSDAVTPTVATSLLFDRGFTGHEHMTVFGLINMNGRVYDPVTSTFLSVDNYVQDPSSTQNFNRYAYCMNNPLKYTDPDGEWAHLVIGALIGGIVNVATNIKHIDTFGEGLAYFGIGAAAGVVGAATGGAAAGLLGTATTLSNSVTSGVISGAVGGFSSGFVTGAGNAWMQGANLGQGLASGLKAGGKGALIGGAVGGMSGGLQYRRTIRLFRKGCERANISPNEDIQMMNDSKLSSLREEWFPEMDMDNIIKLSIDNPGTHLESMIKEGAAGVTVPEELDGLLTGKSSVFFNRANIADLKELFFTMGHEFVHVSQISVLQGELSSIVKDADFQSLMDFHAYNYEAYLGKAQFGMFDNSEKAVLRLFPNDLVNKLNWMNFGYLHNVHTP